MAKKLRINRNVLSQFLISTEAKNLKYRDYKEIKYCLGTYERYEYKNYDEIDTSHILTRGIYN
jgi:hypothetical protein